MAKKALVVDDSKLALIVLKKMLTEESLAVDTVESAEEALGYLINNKPDVIFLDHTMPGMNGLEALRIIKENPETATIPVMMYTSMKGEVYFSQARALGAVNVLPKQLEPAALHEVLRKIHLVQSAANEGDYERRDRVPEAPDPQPSGRMPVADDPDALSLLVRHAESAYEQDNLRQYLRQELEQQGQTLDRIKQRLDRLVVEARDTMSDIHDLQSKAATRGSGLLQLLLLLLLLPAGWYGYQQLRSDMTELAHLNREVASYTVREAAQQPVPSPAAAVTASTEETDLSGLLYVMEESMRQVFTIPYGQQSLSDMQLELLANLLLSLENAQYEGTLDIEVYSGDFCVVANEAGEYVLPPPGTLLTDCQVIDSSEGLDRTIIPQLREFINDNQLNASELFNVVVANWGDALQQEPYPAGVENSAEAWNTAAQANQRIEFVFR